MKKQVMLFLALFSFVLLVCAGTMRSKAAETDETITVPANVRVNGATESTPSPGNAVFHFKIWNDAGVTMNVVSNAVYTNGFGDFAGNLVFTIPAGQLDALKASGFYIQQYDGNADWKFDTNVMQFFWDTDAFKRWPSWDDPTGPKVKLTYAYAGNVYDPQAAAPPAPGPASETITIPAKVRVNGASEQTPDPGAAVFHFRIWSGDPAVSLNVVSNAVTTGGFGEFNGAISFTVPAGSLEALKAAPLYVQQYDGNADWKFDMQVLDFFWDVDKFKRWPIWDDPTGPKIKLDFVSVTNVYDPQPQQAQPVPVPPAPPETPEEAQDLIKELPIAVTEGEEGVQITLPIYIGVEKSGADVPPAAVFHFGIYGMQKDQEYEWVNDVVYTQGEGIYQGNICFTVPQGEAVDQILETGFDVRERSAVVSGWSFAGEVYHIDLEREDGVIRPKIRRFRNVTTAEESKEVLYFLNHYGMDHGEPVEMSGSILGIEDIFRMILDMEEVDLTDTLFFADDEGEWEISWEGFRKDKEIGGVNMTMRYREEGEEFTEITLEDVLRVTRGGIYVKLKSVADAYTALCGEDFPAAKAIPDEEWTGFTEETISWLKLPVVDKLIRRMLRDAGRAFDEFEIRTTDHGYEMTGGAGEWDSFEMLALDMIELGYEDWYTLFTEAALSKEMRNFADAYKAAFEKIGEQVMNNSGLLSVFREGYPAVLSDFVCSVKQEDDSYKVSSTGQMEDEEDGVRTFTNEFTAKAADGEENAEEKEPVEAPENFASGSDFLHDLITLDTLEKGPGGFLKWLEELIGDDE